MKIGKRILSFALVLMLCLALLPAGAVADGEVTIYDVYQGDGFYITATPLIIKDSRYTLSYDTVSIPGNRQFSEGLLMVETDPENDDNYVNRQFVHEVNFVDKNGNLLFPYGTLPYFREIHSSSDDTGLFHDGLCLYWDGKTVENKWGKPLTGYIDKQGRVVADCQFDGGHMSKRNPFSDGLAYVYKNTGMAEEETYYIDTAGNRVAELDTTENDWMFGDFHDGLAYYHEDTYGYYNKRGEQVIKLREGLRPYGRDFSEGYLIAQDLSAGEMSYTYVILDTTGREVGRFSDAKPMTKVHDGLIKIQFINNRNESDGGAFIDVTGKVVFREGEEDPFGLFSHRGSFSCGLAVARDGLIDKAGNLVVPSEHFSFVGLGKDYVYFNDNLAVAYSRENLAPPLYASNKPYVLEKHEGTYTGPGTVYNHAKGGAQTTAPTTPTQPSGNLAYASTQSVLVDGKQVSFEMYALKDADGNPTNYVKLRDIASVVNGTKAQFEVGWDGSVNIETGKAYTSNGSEMKTPYSGDRAYSPAAVATKVNGGAAGLEAIVLTDDSGGAYTYYKLRDLGKALGFNVDWSAEKGVFVETDKPYSGA